jgi:DNA-binding transcriptional LysR family regulator
MFSLKQLQAIYWISKLGTYSAAAKKLHISESTISKRINEIESLVGIELLDRQARHSRLTREGINLVIVAEKIIALCDDYMKQLGRPEAMVHRYRIGVTELVGLTWLPDLLTSLKDYYPEVLFEPEIDVSTALADKLMNGGLDLIIVPLIIQDPSVTSRSLKKMRLEWMSSPSLFEGRHEISLRELMRYPILTQNGRSGVDTVFETWLKSTGISGKKLYAGNSLMTLASLTISGLGISYLPKLYFSDLVDNGSLKIITTEQPIPEIQYNIVVHNETSNSRFDQNIIKICETLCDFSKHT